MSRIIANKYKIDQIIAKGSFGYVFKGFYLGSNEPVAIKIEKSDNIKSLKHETKILNYLYSNKVRKIPAIYWYGEYGENPCLIISYYEYSLADYIKKKDHIKNLTDKSMPSKIIATIIDILSNIHKNFIIHRDLKPENFMIKNNEIYLIDFGLATFFIGEDGQHLQNESVDTIIGSPRWISRNILEGNRYSRRDDMISLGYIYCYLVLERTPWELEESDIIRINCKFNNLEKIDKININHPINIWRKENRILDIFKNILEGYPKIYDYLKTVYSYSYMDIPKYDLLVKICIE